MKHQNDVRWSRALTLRGLPADLTVTAVLTLLADLGVLLPVIRETPLRTVLSLPLLLFLPGYALVSVAFPAANSTSDRDERDGHRRAGAHWTRSEGDRGIDTVERVGLSFGMSVALLPILGLAISMLFGAFEPVPIVGALSAFVLGGVVLGAVRRWRLPENRRFAVRYRARLADLRNWLFGGRSGGGVGLNLVLVISVVLAMSSITYAVAVPRDGSSSSQLTVLTENDAGDLVTSGYPTEFERGESQPMYVGVENDEGENVNYTVVVKLQRVRTSGESTTVLQEETLRRMEATVDDDGTWRQRHAVTPTLLGENLRLTYLLYKTTPPEDPGTENAYGDAYVWINVSPA